MAVGNRLEVEEAWRVLTGEGPEDVREVSLTLATVLLAASDLGLDEGAARERAEAALADGRAAEHFERWCYVQGGRWKPGEFHRLAAREVCASAGGYLAAVDALAVGRAAQLAGAGRSRVDDSIDPAAGVVLSVQKGASVEAGEVLAVVYAREEKRRAAAQVALEGAFVVAPEAPPPTELILGRD
jgi:thymidine phosphorylase